jgi:hypothetical protein
MVMGGAAEYCLTEPAGFGAGEAGVGDALAPLLPTGVCEELQPANAIMAAARTGRAIRAAKLVMKIPFEIR